MLIKARLKGHEFDLLTLAELFGTGDPAVAVDDEGYYLCFTAPDELFGDGGGLHNAASVLLRRVNGVARTLSNGDLARHARLKGDLPRRTMTLGEARQLIGSLVRRWLDWLRESSNA
jgi:hypothetical protein